jgi:hypothetical protein
MSLTIWAAIFTAVGDIIIAYMVISVHDHIMKEKKVDQHIFRYMRREKFFGSIGIAFVIIGLVLFIIGETMT